MKLFLGPRQTGNTMAMIDQVASSVSRAYLSDRIGDNFRILIVAPKLNVCYEVAKKLISEINYKLKNIISSSTQHDKNSFIVTLQNGNMIYVYMEKAEDITLTRLTEYDRVIIDEVFEHYPFDEHILVRGTVDLDKR